MFHITFNHMLIFVMILITIDKYVCTIDSNIEYPFYCTTIFTHLSAKYELFMWYISRSE